MVKVIAIAGMIGAGKDTVAEHIAKKYGYTIIQLADILRDMAKREGFSLDRDGLLDLRKKRGNIFLAKEAVKQIKKRGIEKVVYIPVRRSEDYEIPKKEFGDSCVLIVVEATQNIRFERMKARNRHGDPTTQAEFDHQEKREFELFNFEKTFSYRDFVVENNKTVEKLYAQIDRVMEKIR